MAVNYGGAVQGGLGGAASGATIGSMLFPGIGTAIGAGIGGLAGLFAGGAAKKKSPWAQSPSLQTPEGQAALKMLLEQGTQGIRDPYAGFDPIAKQQREEFKTQTIPSIMERFTAAGGSGTLHSSGLEGKLGAAGAGLDTQLAALKANYGLSNRQGLLQQLQLGLNPQTENLYMGEQPGVGGQLWQMGSGLAGAYLGAGGNFGSQQQGTITPGAPKDYQRQGIEVRSPDKLVTLLLDSLKSRKGM